ncbi:Putative peptidoglycan binding domain-containing protein [Fictibacillus solisalsi]|uniref:Putative peptidoglycan binding domain-containing protein n=1 Tax=Fictibacillus solisalsi TaxID=459525 RepID=A0A1G9Y1Z0_9BACL|nr:peptidoglycan-binding protein [Fictibacillus solisalsi]SDN03030.1 Putative peptidoglycan binding domain-containing protein [Fictibacillus solisalsi]
MKKGNANAVKTLVISSACAGAILLLPSKGEAALGDQVLKNGMNNPDVKELQRELMKQGYLKSKYITGYYGPLTTNAVKEFQRKHHLVIDGVTGKMTVKAITQKTAASAPKKATGYTTLKQGSQGYEVDRLQKRLKELKFFTYSKITGYYGRITAEAVKSYQRANHLSVTGIADDTTQKAIFSSASPAPVKTPAQAVPDGLQKNDRGQMVYELQSSLKSLGYYKYNLDSIFGRITEAGVKSFQRTYKLPVTGVADSRTMEKIRAEVGKRNEKPASTTPAVQALKLRSTGQEVYQLQSNLKVLGFYTYKVDSIFGKITEMSVKSFQKANALSTTGIADSKTIEKIKAEVKKKGIEPAKPQTPAKSFNVINLVGDAAELVGTPYTWGGDTISEGFDCSGFLVYLFKKQNIQLPRTVASIWNVGKAVSSPKVGDVVFFETYKKGPSHAGIYIGNNRFVHSGSSGVTVSDLGLSYWSSRYLGSKQLY